MEAKNNLLIFTIVIIVLLCISNAILLALLWNEKKRTTHLVNVLEKNGLLSLAQIEPKKAKEPPQVASRAQPVPQTKEIPSELFSSPDIVPSPFILAVEGEYILLCEKQLKRLSLVRSMNGTFTLVKAYRCIVGANHHDKQKPGDEATPEGVFFLVRFIPGARLPKKYGYGAFVLNYPDFLSRRQGKGGNGIWLHGHSKEQNIGKDLVNTKGCISTDNDFLKEIATYIKPVGTPFVIIDKVETIKKQDQDAISQEIKSFLNAWKESWERIDTKKYLSFYASDFISSDGMNYENFKNHKEKVNSTKKLIKLNIDNMAIFTPAEYNGSVAVVRFRQKYHSNNFDSDSKKIFYLRKEKGSWYIIGETIIS
ncbi:MAG TPA: hypothetical protein DDW17_08955 [Deltaproteobacteria bacterium]|nr:hypothetical protein [Deltaproteobacteria bacterium]